jgi:hypothetical protein
MGRRNHTQHIISVQAARSAVSMIPPMSICQSLEQFHMERGILKVRMPLR